MSYIYIYVCVCVRVCVLIYAVHLCMCICMCVCVCACTSVHACMSACDPHEEARLKCLHKAVIKEKSLGFFLLKSNLS